MPSRLQQSPALPKSYVPAEHEPRIRQHWESSGVFHAEPTQSGDDRPTYCILIPPPNVTAALHLGHAFNNTLQDVLIRYHRMRGFNTLWMPGTDHAGIATQAVVEKRLLQEGKRRTDFSRDDFVELVQQWKDEYEATITEQLKIMGCSCDWLRQRFTMDDICVKAVREAFFRLFREGLIYRGKRLVNWDPVTQTALADDEVEMKEVEGKFYYLRYPLVHPPRNPDDPKDTEPVTWSELAARGYRVPEDPEHAEDQPAWLTVATTRPETYLGDTAVAVSPKDPRAASLAELMVQLPLVGRVIPVIVDDYVVLPDASSSDPKAQYATGFLKVTPGHDPNDWEIGIRHDLPVVNVMAPDGSISDAHGWEDIGDAHLFVGMTRDDARKKVVQEFEGRGLLEQVKPYRHSIGHSYRSHVPIEPYLSDQWYVKVTDDRLVGEAQRALADDQFEGSKPLRETSSEKAAGDGEMRFFPARYAKMYQSWHDNLRDWCISRQLWWGHRIPVWSRHCDDHVTWRGSGLKTERDAWQDELSDRLWSLQENEHRVHTWFVAEDDPARLFRDTPPQKGAFIVYVCIGDEAEQPPHTGEHSIVQLLEKQGFTQDPDVLDTWFSSGLWPLSTMGWPDPGAFPDEYPQGDALLQTFNPSSVLCTAREIITLWVSRMVMFNRCFLPDHRVPFRHVYIHAMIQDGHGQKMSKSLGNGVDPRDIIDTHGADALRFTCTQIATATQDVRLPVDTLCPHCGETFHPKEITSPGGYRVGAPTQTCPSCRKEMVTVYGASSGDAKPSNEKPLARNTSSKFDLGRNFANKLWNAARFALSRLPDNGADPHPPLDDLATRPLDDLATVDRWIISRLHRTLHVVEDALAEYRFNAYADAMYDFVWRDFCDWYLEAIKPTIAERPPQQQVLRTVLNATLRLLHPICPFVTEALWPHVQAKGAAGLDGVELPAPAGDDPILAAAAWPDIECRVENRAAVATFERLQTLTEAIRNRRGEHQVQPKKQIVLHATPEVMQLLENGRDVVTTLAGLKSVLALGHDTPEGSIPLPFEGQELRLSGLIDDVDLEAERSRLAKRITEKKKAIGGYRGKLSNQSYVENAPPQVVQETRDRLAEAAVELEAAENALASLG